MDKINNHVIMMQGFTCDSMDAFDVYPAVRMSPALSFEQMGGQFTKEYKCKCSFCGQWGKAKNECSYCGAPIDG